MNQNHPFNVYIAQHKLINLSKNLRKYYNAVTENMVDEIGSFASLVILEITLKGRKEDNIWSVEEFTSIPAISNIMETYAFLIAELLHILPEENTPVIIFPLGEEEKLFKNYLKDIYTFGHFACLIIEEFIKNIRNMLLTPSKYEFMNMYIGEKIKEMTLADRSLLYHDIIDTIRDHGENDLEDFHNNLTQLNTVIPPTPGASSLSHQATEVILRRLSHAQLKALLPQHPLPKLIFKKPN